MHERNFGKVLVSSSLMVGVGACSPDQEDDVPPAPRLRFPERALPSLTSYPSNLLSPLPFSRTMFKPPYCHLNGKYDSIFPRD